MRSRCRHVSKIAGVKEIELRDGSGEPFRLSKVLAGGPVVLAFFRGDW